ncbi:penicillin-binding protein 1B [Marinobacterium mangrovicola]|uniref:Penicillin-binding protein 1B n=1 Tax=Marinobacterium mangrovicola TaxID=1476959 RepID=A0A4R1GDP0_9GAMM|nr:penicillin-binding protein 1B [Marinobacterium mangrovicola]TCK04993.1 penicillin-binding protein 1B [Marinobacterium mangrovicola]
MSKKRNSRKPARGRKASRSWFRKLLGLLLKLALVLSVVAAAGLVYLDAQVREKFEGKRWALPAKVYARPLELYPGQALTADDFKIELQALGYRSVSSASRPGTVHWSGNSARIVTRSFPFPDGVEASRTLQLDFGSGGLQRLRDGGGGSLSLVRMEPMMIGGIYPKDNEDRDLIRLEDAPPSLPAALIAVEDRDYYDHFGISLRGIARAMWVNARAGRFVQGGSTLTQQLIKNFYLTADRTLARKLLEMPMAVLLDLHYDKEEILEAYLNEVYLGQSGARAIHGFGMGSRYYFGRPVGELSLAQSALLAGLVKGPSYFDPRRHPERALERRNLVLRLMKDQEKIDEEQYQAAVDEPLGVVAQGGLRKGAYPAYLDLVKRQLQEEYRDEDLSSEGLRVFTALDPLVQSRAERAQQDWLKKLESGYNLPANELESSMVVADPQTGEILSVIGGRNSSYEGFNRALDALRPVGSLVKPAVYLTALEQGYTLASQIEDEAFDLELPNGDIWSPDNFDHKSHGDVALHYALSRSYNQATAKLGLDIGVEKVVDMLERLGVDRELKPYPSLLLGAQALSPLEVAGVYQTIAANGFRVPLRAIRSVTDAEGEELSRYPFKLRQQVDPRLVHLIQYAMQEVAREGTARYSYSVLPNNLNIAGKTGTSNGQRDSWFAGFTGNRLAVVWVGRDDNATLPFTGSGGALRVWTDFMRREHPEPFYASRPEGVEYAWIDEATGLQSDKRCEGSQQLPFLAGTEPQDSVDCGQRRSRSNNPLDWFRGWFQ